MMLRRYLLMTLSLLLLLPTLNARPKKTKSASPCGNNQEFCQDLANSCQCYCAFKPGPRDKQPDDTLIFVEGDPYGHYCYCKQRDIDKVKEDQEPQRHR